MNIPPECYFRWCKWHHQDEPFCTRKRCSATSGEIEQYREWREEELEEEHAKDRDIQQ